MPINLPNGSNVGEIVLPNGSNAERVIGPDGSTLWERNATPDSVVAQYDATVESSTGAITSISDLISDFDLSGNAEVISGGINGLQTYRFDGTESMSHSSTITTSDPFAVIMVIQQRQSSSGNFILDGGSQDELRVQDGNNDRFDLARSDYIGGDGTPDTSAHILLVEAYNEDRARLEIDGTEVVDGQGSTTDLTGLIFPASPSRDELEADIGQIEVTVDHSSADLQSIKERLQEKWGTPSLS